MAIAGKVLPRLAAPTVIGPPSPDDATPRLRTRIQGRVLALTLGLSLAAVVLSVALPTDRVPLAGWLVLVVGVVVAELRPVTVVRRTQHQNFTLIEGPVVVALALAPGAVTVLGVAAGIALAQMYRRIVPFKLAFNVALFAFATSAAAVCAVIVPGAPGVLLGIVVFTTVNEVLMRVVLWLATGSRFGYAWQEGDSVRLLHVAAAISVGLLATATWEHDPHLLPAFLGPIALVQWSQEQANRRRAQGSIASALAQQAASLFGRSSRESALLILRSARELLTCDEAEIVLLGPDGAVVLRDGLDRPRSAEEERLEPQQLLEGWTGKVLEHVQVVVQDRWAGVVIGSTEPLALLAVWRGPDQDVFREMDRALLQQLADDVRLWLTVDVEMSDLVGAARMRAAELGGRYEEVAQALGGIVRVRQALLAGVARETGAEQRLGEELHVAAEAIAVFVSDLLSVPEQVRPDDDVVHTGRWFEQAAG